MTKAWFIEKIKALVADDAGKLNNPADYEQHIDGAIKKYSKHRPAIKVIDVVGVGSHDLDLPASWVEGFSLPKAVEFPIGDVPATLIDTDTFDLYITPTGTKLRLSQHSILATESIRLSFTLPREVATIPVNDESALVWLATSLCCAQLANAYSQTSDATIGADSVNYRTKGQEFTSRAKQMMNLYMNHLGLKSDDVVAPAVGIKETHSKARGKLTH